MMKKALLPTVIALGLTLTGCGGGNSNSAKPKTQLAFIGVHDSEMQANTKGEAIVRIKAPKNATITTKYDTKVNGSWHLKLQHISGDIYKGSFTLEPKIDSVIVTVTAKSKGHRTNTKDVLVNNDSKLVSKYRSESSSAKKASSIKQEAKDDSERASINAALDSTSKYSESVKRQNSEADATYSSNSKEDKLQSNQDLTTVQISSFNRQLSKGLAEDQKLADQGNDSYGWASSIDSVKYDKNRGLLVQAEPTFSEATKRVKTAVAHNIQGDASIALTEINVDYTDPITVSFYNGNTKIGGSSMFNPATMKWK